MTRIEYLGAERRAELDRAERSWSIALRQQNRRHERQAISHERRAALLAVEILDLVTFGGRTGRSSEVVAVCERASERLRIVAEHGRG